MRTTVTIDDELFAKAMSLAEPGMERSDLFKECIKAFIQRQTARRLAARSRARPSDSPRLLTYRGQPFHRLARMHFMTFGGRKSALPNRRTFDRIGVW